MEHRNLNHRDYTLAAIDDIIARGRAKDWVQLNFEASSHEGVRTRIARVCQHYLHDSRAQRYHFWQARLHPSLGGLRVVGAALLQPGTVEPDRRARLDELLVQVRSAPPQGCLDGIETSVRQLVRTEPFGSNPTLCDLLEITAVLVLKRNGSRDYLDLVNLANCLGPERTCKAFDRFDALYPQPSGESALLQLEVQLAGPVPHDLGSMEAPVSWQEVNNACGSIAQILFSQVTVPQHGG